MPAGEQHSKQAQHNIQFLETFYEKHLFNDWAITVAFYSSVHIIENAIFNTQDICIAGHKIRIAHSTDLPTALNKINTSFPAILSSQRQSDSPHAHRNVIVQENFAEVSDHYKCLFRESHNSRYRKYQFSNNEVNLIVKPALRVIVDWSNLKFKTSLVLNLK